MTISNNYVVTQYSRAVPAIARAKNDQILTDADTTAPFAEDNRKALKIAKIAQYDVVFVGSVDDYRFDAAKKQASITISGRLLETETDKVLKSVTLSADSSEGGSADESEKAIQAARSATDKLLTQLVPISTIVSSPNTTPVKSTPKKKRANMDWLWGLVIVGVGLGIGIASSGGGGGGGGGGNDNPPPPPN
jgi:hypothetical protein